MVSVHLFWRTRAEGERCSSILLCSLGCALERSGCHDGGKLATVFGGCEPVTEDLGLPERLDRILVCSEEERFSTDTGDRDRSLPRRPDERGGTGERESRCGMLDRDVRGAGTRRRNRNDDRR